LLYRHSSIFIDRLFAIRPEAAPILIVCFGQKILLFTCDNRRLHPEMESKDLQCRICWLTPKDESLMPTEMDFLDQIKRCTGVEVGFQMGLLCFIFIQ